MSTRWASLLVLASTVLSWASGVAAEHQRSRGLYVCFSVSTIVLGVLIVTLRITTEDQVPLLLALWRLRQLRTRPFSQHGKEFAYPRIHKRTSTRPSTRNAP